MLYQDSENNSINDFNYDFIINEPEEPDEPEIRFTREQIITISECPTKSMPDPHAKYVGKFLYKTESNTLILGVCAERIQTDFAANFAANSSVDNRNIAVSYILLRSLYGFNAQIVSIREAVDDDRFYTGDMLDELSKNIHTSQISHTSGDYNKYIFEVIPQTSPEKQQRREFFRMPLKIDIYYKPISKIEVDNIKSSDLKFDADQEKKMIYAADEGLLETEKGYLKLSTIDISAGGFRCKHHIGIDVNTYLECVLMINNINGADSENSEALPVIARTVGSVSDEFNPRLYDLRASFDKINDVVRNKLVKYIFYQQRQLQAKFLKRRF